MNRAEAVKVLYEIRHYLTQGNPIWSTDVVDEVLSMAINASERGCR